MAKNILGAAVALALAGGLVACGTPTPYQPNIPGQATSGGYSDLRLEANRWRVSFAGNSLTSRETVEAYLLYRAAELTAQQGYDWFEIVDRHTERNARTYVQPDPLYRPYFGYGYWRPSWRYYGRRFGGWRTWDPFWGDPFWADRVDIQTVEKFEAAAEIIMHRGAKPADDPRAFDARAVVANLRPRIQYPAPRAERR
jgi:hypothetical protein